MNKIKLKSHFKHVCLKGSLKESRLLITQIELGKLFHTTGAAILI